MVPRFGDKGAVPEASGTLGDFQAQVSRVYGSFRFVNTAKLPQRKKARPFPDTPFSK